MRDAEKTKYLFLLNALGVQKKILAHASEKEEAALLAAFDKQEIEVLFVLGMGAVSCVDKLIEWIAQKERHEVVLLEESLEALNAFLDEPKAVDFLACDRCSLRIKMPDRNRVEYIKEIAEEFPSGAVEVVSFGPMSNLHEAYEYHIRKHASLSFFGQQQDIEYHRIVENVVGNIPAIKRASLFDAWPKIFAGKTAIVCGAGPSLAKYYSLLRGAKGIYPILAGGSAIPLLTHEGIVPDLGIAIDPNKTELDRLSTLDRDMPLVFSGRLHPGVLQNHAGEAIYQASSSGGFFEEEIVKALSLPFQMEDAVFFQSTTVASKCLAVACHLGCKTIVLLGFDLAYSEGKRYPDKVPDTFGEIAQEPTYSYMHRVWDVNRLGERVETTILWKMERDALGNLVDKWCDHTFIALEHEGLVIPGASYISTLPPQKKWDNSIEVLLKKAIEEHKHAHSSHIDALLEKSIESLKRVRALIERMLKEFDEHPPRGPLLDVLLMDVQAECSYDIFLKPTMIGLEKLFNRKRFNSNSLKDRLLCLFELTDKYLSILNKETELV